MDIRTKLALALVFVSLLSMLLLGNFAYKLASDMFQETSERQLDALAETRQQDLANVIEGWRNDVRLIRSRTRLRINLAEYQVEPDPERLAEMERIVADAQESSDHVERIVVFDRSGTALAVAGHALVPAQPLRPETGEPRYSGLYLDNGRPKVVFHSAVFLEDEDIGGVEVVIDASKLMLQATNYRGLGKTGEAMVVGRDLDDRLTVLHPLRFTDAPIAMSSPPAYVLAAINGESKIFTSGVRDYRDQPVWAATRYLDDVDWGIVVKIDTEEESERPRTLRSNLIDLGLALGAFAIVGGTLLGSYLAQPIRELAEVIDRVRHGETELRAHVRTDDEVALVAEALNNYLDQVGTDIDQSDEDA